MARQHRASSHSPSHRYRVGARAYPHRRARRELDRRRATKRRSAPRASARSGRVVAGVAAAGCPGTDCGAKRVHYGGPTRLDAQTTALGGRFTRCCNYRACVERPRLLAAERRDSPADRGDGAAAIGGGAAGVGRPTGRRREASAGPVVVTCALPDRRGAGCARSRGSAASARIVGVHAVAGGRRRAEEPAV